MKHKIALFILSFAVVVLVNPIKIIAQQVHPPAEVLYPKLHDTSQPLQEMVANAPEIPTGPPREARRHEIPEAEIQRKPALDFDPVVQHQPGMFSPLATVVNFDGINSTLTVPPDPNGDVSPNHYIQTVNAIFAVYSKTGTLLLGPSDLNTLWAGFTGPWTTMPKSDPIVLYDPLADRWLVTVLAFNFSGSSDYELLAVSQTSDPLGAWYRYAFEFNHLPDYPKFAVWPDGYYMSANRFTLGSPPGYLGMAGYVFERDAMLAGQTARMVSFTSFTDHFAGRGLLPSDFDGTAPPTNTPNYFAYVIDGETQGGNDRFGIYELHVNWSNPATSTFTGPTQLTTAPFNRMCVGTRNCVPQQGTIEGLDLLGDRLMYRLQYRNFGSYQSMVTNHSVDAGGSRAGVRWYELRNSGNGWGIYQQGTYAPSDGLFRWMGSIAIDGVGNIGLGYSTSSSSTYPSIRFTGRKASDPLGQMTLTESTIKDGTGSQVLSANRWGDYSMMTVDPTDDRTFWFTSEYYQTTGSSNWRTRIAAFQIVEISVDQQLAVAGRLSGTNVGHWDGSSFTDLAITTSPAKIISSVGSREVLRGLQQLATNPSEKYRVWERNGIAQVDTVQNHRGFTIRQDDADLTSRFQPTDPTITIKTDLIDAPGTTGGAIKFHDPWYIDYPDPDYGSNLRNRGMQQAEYRTRSLTGQFALGWKPDFTTTYPESPDHPYRGVFLNENPTFDPTKPYYSVGALLTQNIGGYSGFFSHWSASTNAQGQPTATLRSAEKDTSAVVFLDNNAAVIANYKLPLRSSLATSSGPNGQRKLTTYGTTTHMVYASGGSIFYSRNTGGSWSNEVALALSSTASNPSIATSTYCGCTNYGLHVVWEEIDPANPSQSVVRYRRSTDGGLTWLPRIDIGVGSLPSTPVIGGFDNPAIVWKTPAGLSVRTDPQWNPSYTFSVSETDGTSREFSLAKNYDGYYLSYIKGATGSGKPWVKRFTVQLNPYSVSFYAAQDLTAGYTQLTNSANTSVTTDNLARVWVAWDGYGFYDEEGDSPTVVPSARRVFFRDRVSLNPWGPPTGVQYSNTNTEPVIGVLQGTAKISLLWQSNGVDVLRYTRPISGGTASISLLGQGRLPTEAAYTPGSNEYRMWAGLNGPPHTIVIGNGKVTRMNEGNELAFNTSRLAFLSLDSLQFGTLPPGAVSGAMWINANEFTSVSGTLRERLPFMDDPTRYDEWLSTNAFQLGANADSLSSQFRLGISGFRINDELVDMNTPIADVKVEVGKAQHMVRSLKLSDLIRFGTEDTSATYDGSLSIRNLRGRTVKIRQRLVGQDQNRQPLWAQLLKVEPPEIGITEDRVSITSLTTLEKDIPINYALHPNHPNPFNPATQIRFDLPEPSNVSLVIYDILGKQVAELVGGAYEAGYHSVPWNASSFASGVYLARFVASDASGALRLSTTQKLLLTK